MIPHDVNPWIYNTRQNLSLAIKAKRGYRFNHLIGCTVTDFRWHLERQFRDGMSFDNYGEWSISHTVTCCSFPIDDPDAKFQCHHWSNLRPLWAGECAAAAFDHLIEKPDYETLRHFTPRATVINEYGVPALATGLTLDMLPILDKVYSRTESLKAAYCSNNINGAQFCGQTDTQTA